jgi:formylglycine-generating enzyme required for sulfatase activity
MTGRHLALFTLLTVAVCQRAAWLPADEPVKTEKPAADPMLRNEAGDVRDDNALKMKMVWCLPGVFDMERVERVSKFDVTVTPVGVLLSRGYWLGKYEVTQGEWKRLMATRPWKGKDFTKEGADFPATYVNWDDAMAFCSTLTEQERQSGRLPDDWEYVLPTEAQWERACRARTNSKFNFGNDESQLGEYTWFDSNTANVGEHFAHCIGQKKPNPWGLHDMHGNVYEWCRDYFMEKPPGGRDPLVTTEYSRFAQRGGSWSSRAESCCSAVRSNAPGAMRMPNMGFRVALSPVQPAK